MTVVVTYVLMPFTLRVLGQDGYGTWLLISSVTGYLNLLMLGVPMASVRQFSMSLASGDERDLNVAVATCAGLFLLLGALALAGGLGLFAFFELTYSVPAAIRPDARWAFLIVVVQLATGFVMQVPYGMLGAQHEFVRRNAISASAILVRLVLTLVLLQVVPSLVILAAIQFACALLEFTAGWLLIRRLFPAVRLDLALFDRAMLRRIFAFSAFVLLLNLAAQLTFQSDSLVIGRMIGIERIPYYAIGNSLVVNLMSFVIAIGGVVMPMAVRMGAKGELKQLREVYLTWSKIALSLTLVVAVFLLVIGPDFVGWWIGPAFRDPTGRVLRILMWSGLLFIPARGVALPLLMGLGHAKWPTIAFLVAGVANLGISIGLARPLGLAGVAIGTAVPNVIVAVFILVLACRALELPVGTFVRHVVVRTAIGSMPVVGVLVALKSVLDMSRFANLVIGGTAMLLVFALVWVGYVYRGDPYVDLPGRLRGLLARRA